MNSTQDRYHRPFEPAQFAPGELAWVAIRNPQENPASIGKPRPAVLVEHVGGTWMTMGLTTNGWYRNGSRRSPIPCPAAVGLRRPGFLWGDRLTRVSVLDIGEHIGWVDSALADLIISQAGLDKTAAEALRAAAETHRPQPPSAHVA